MKHVKTSCHQVDTVRKLYYKYRNRKEIRCIGRGTSFYVYHDDNGKAIPIDIDAFDRDILTHYKSWQFLTTGEFIFEDDAISSLYEIPVHSMKSLINSLKGMLKHTDEVRKIAVSIYQYSGRLDVIDLNDDESPCWELIMRYCEHEFKITLHEIINLNSIEKLNYCLYELKNKANKRSKKTPASMTRELLAELNIPVQSINQSINQSIIRK